MATNCFEADILLQEVVDNIKTNNPIDSHMMSSVNELKDFLNVTPKNGEWGFFAATWREILEYAWSSHVIKELQRLDILVHFLKSVSLLENVPQDKVKSLNAFQHTLRVLNIVDREYPNDIAMKIAALFHDAGKIKYFTTGNFYGHEKLSGDYLTCHLLFSMLCNRGEIERAWAMVRYHMLPLAYQRNPNWKDETIARFNNKLEPYTQDVIDFAICDKWAHLGICSPLLLELKERVANVQ